MQKQVKCLRRGCEGKLTQVRVHGRFLKNNQTRKVRSQSFRDQEAVHSKWEKLQEEKPRGGEHMMFS